MFPLYDKNRSRTFPFVMFVLIVINVLVFWWELSEGLDDRIFLVYGGIPALVMQGKQLLSLVTSMFIHGDFLHLLGNMIYLLVFGDNVEDRFGHVKFFLLYFVFGIVGGLTHSAIAVMSRGVEQYIPFVGASGAVAGILGAYIVFYPGAKIGLARIPAFIFIGFWFILQILYSGGSSTVAYMAHIGGFMTGLVIALISRVLNRGKRTRLY